MNGNNSRNAGNQKNRLNGGGKANFQDDWRNNFDNLKVSNNASNILEMVTRGTSGNGTGGGDSVLGGGRGGEGGKSEEKKSASRKNSGGGKREAKENRKVSIPDDLLAATNDSFDNSFTNDTPIEAVVATPVKSIMNDDLMDMGESGGGAQGGTFITEGFGIDNGGEKEFKDEDKDEDKDKDKDKNKDRQLKKKKKPKVPPPKMAPPSTKPSKRSKSKERREEEKC